ncbi:serine threonine protein kinase [Aspergillus sclerotialis]|uniref:Autophagy-related protein 1 n=1 Tax=Aspergillus sclerotialis TaxID=2070753 RepID=A0A3A2ZKT4_9EURO|nr:serine threonine protein kinase [Aspergillus sclerotialis]
MALGARPVVTSITENEDHHHAVRKREERKRLACLRNIVTNRSLNRHIPLLSPKISSPTSPIADSGTYKGAVYKDLSSTIKLYEKSPGKEIVAIKTFHNLTSNTTSKRDILSDKSILLSLKHPNIVKFIDLFSDDNGHPCLVMEYCDGGNLHALATTMPNLDITNIGCVFKQMVRGIHYLHWNGIVHGNLNPRNILLTRTGTVKITGFDDAQHCTIMLSQSRSGGHAKISDCGPYTAPEVISAEGLNRPAIDVWALGALYLFLRNGRPMWSVAKEEDRMYSRYLKERMQKKGFAPIGALGSEPLRNVIYAMLNPEPPRRISLSETLRSEWLYGVRVCEAGERA